MKQSTIDWKRPLKHQAWLRWPVALAVTFGCILGVNAAIDGHVKFGPAIGGAIGATIGVMAVDHWWANRSPPDAR